ncbi:glycoside hydrolase family 30 protein [Spirosoma utsteinense]|uniref:O-glycosyl hydrolase n=1 Tax=Spirosoma utsteinense TaxID=2585773 RepID=A0ABR6VZ29_9BACT|nr:glycoside hydrolase family 30 protein [Spirosoma utsteinense]MBC3784684.1 O-glycosyl hydrolase [Spirosoma utsteinense]MBC3789562.1 O-glycosyl hydrolase [Spirosoma utsteinense]
MHVLSRAFLPWLLVNSLLIIGSCKADKPAPVSRQAADTKVLKLTIDPKATFQTIDHFGASDAWACQFVGNWPTATRSGIADLLFSRDTLPTGQLKGIGLSLWRFNIGAGTAEQGDKSGIKDEWRRAESFLKEDGTYDWTKQSGQVWFLQAARDRGVAEFLAFPNSPPVQFTTNHKGYANKGLPNLNPDQFDSYTRFLARVVAGVRDKTGITFQYVSPVNEPQWDWSDGGQEGTPFFNNQIAGLTRSLSAALLTEKLPTQINIAEAGQIDYLYSDHNRPGRSSQIKAFFQKTSPDYLGDLPNVTRAISGHSYFTTSPYKAAAARRRQLATDLAASGLKYWMSEYCILGDNEGEIRGEGRDLGIDPALYVASVIHNDLTHANASAWHWWIALSPYNYKDGLIYVDKNKTGGSYQPARMLWALGNYSQFIRPGAVRVAATLDSDSDDVLVSSFRNNDQKLITVIVNRSNNAVTIESTLTTGTLRHIRLYQTAADKALMPIQANAAGSFTVAAKSITTLVGDYSN